MKVRFRRFGEREEKTKPLGILLSIFRIDFELNTESNF